VDPIRARLGPAEGVLLEIGFSGALFEHRMHLPQGLQTGLTFERSGRQFILPTDIMRSVAIDSPSTTTYYHSGLRFQRSELDSALRDLIAGEAKNLLMAQAANAMGVRMPNLTGSGDRLVPRRPPGGGFLIYILHLNVWERTPSMSPEQPDEGFTVSVYEDPDELDNLCRVYESSDEDGRKLIRVLAELSLRDNL